MALTAIPISNKAFAPRCVAIDLEVGRRDGRIHRFAAIRGDSGEQFVYRQGDLAKALSELDAFAAGSSFLLGHNLLAFDLPHLAAAKANLQLLQMPVVDTLRLNPLAFPRNPYHYLVKDYQDGQLRREQINDPLLDAELSLKLFGDQRTALAQLQHSQPELLSAWHWLSTVDRRHSGLNALFSSLRGRTRPNATDVQQAISSTLAGRACANQATAIIKQASEQAWELAYALAWISVAGGNSVMPAWVRHQFPMAPEIVHRLRHLSCGDRQCPWCSLQHDPRAQLKRCFGEAMEFRPEPRDPHSGLPLQQLIVDGGLRGQHQLGILPTGTGKSLCYQIPALARFEHTGALSVVISPLVALMADQVNGLEARGHSSAAAFNGMLSMPERADVLERLRLGDLAILIISPEQLRNRSLRKALAAREIGGWVIDEAHCISKWGHDFRPDYRYIARFIGERAGGAAPPPILALTATAKPEVITDIVEHFRSKLGIELQVHDGGASRDNLAFDVIQTSHGGKLDDVYQLLGQYLPGDSGGGAIVYCASRRHTEEMAEFLKLKEIAAGYFHAGLRPDSKKSTQQAFITGQLRVICATNAFGMGIDKPDVRLVIHADIPGSLENYLQEAGRAGRDREHAHCVLLYCAEDVDHQFGLSARSRLSQRDIQSVLQALRRLDQRKHGEGAVVATSGEILSEDFDRAFERNSMTDDTRVRTALSWLEEATLLTREENRVQVFPSSLKVLSLVQAKQRMQDRPGLSDSYQRQLLSIVSALFEADPDDGISTDELMQESGLSAEQVRTALFDLEQLGIASNDTSINAYVHSGVVRSSLERLQQASALEQALIEALREAHPDLQPGDHAPLHLRIATQRLKDDGHPQALPEQLLRVIKSLATDGRGEDESISSLSFRRLDGETLNLRLQRPWSALARTAELRRTGAGLILGHFLSCLPPAAKGNDLLASTTLGKLLAALQSDLLLNAQISQPPKLLDRALIWLHEMEVIRVHKGLAVFRPAMTIKLSPERRKFIKLDFEPLRQHYRERGVQIHVMAEYAQRGLQAIGDALRLTADYFALDQQAFLRRWLPDRQRELERETTPESWRRIVEDLRDPVQQRIVADDRERSNVLVLAGPGSGKTRVLVHRIAYLVRVKREDPRRIVALAYNHHAAVDIRLRLQALLGEDARGLTVLTCHALAMRLTGVSFANRAQQVSEQRFRQLLIDAAALLRGDGLPTDQADEQRDRLLAGFRWILVDEYQDIGAEQYALIAALAGRSTDAEDGRLSLFAVGDDDQNIYAFDGASVAFIRRFEQDYSAQARYLVHNYRSSAHIIGAANRLISGAADRLKTDHPIAIDPRRRKQAAGGRWQRLDPVAKGRARVIPAGIDSLSQAMAVMAELQRLAALSPDWDWSRVAAIGRQWALLEPLRSYCEAVSIPVQLAIEDSAQFWRLRETQALVDWLRLAPGQLIKADKVTAWLADQTQNPWWALLTEALEQYALQSLGAELPAAHLLDWLAEWGREVRRRQHGLLLLTAHRAKGLEFEHVVVLDGGWQGRAGEDPDAERRLYYVAMTRARSTLCLAQLDVPVNPLLRELDLSSEPFHQGSATPAPPLPALHWRYRRLGMAEVDLGYAGRKPPEHPLHGLIAELQTDDPLHLQARGERWMLVDSHGRVVGRLAKSYGPPAGMRCQSAKVAAIVLRYASDSEPEFAHLAQCQRWETVLPELVFVPDTDGTA